MTYKSLQKWHHSLSIFFYIVVNNNFIMNDLNQPQASFLIVRLLDELTALILSLWAVREGGVDGVEVSYEGDEPLDRLAFIQRHFDPYKHLKLKDFMVNVGSYLSELIGVFTLTNIPEFAILRDYLAENVDIVHNKGSIINGIEENNKIEQNKRSDFN